MRNIYYKNNTKTKYKYIPCPNTATNSMQNYTHHYQYDELGNMLQIQSVGNWTRDYVYNANNNYLLKHDTQQTFDDYTYDEHGNMLSMPHLSNMSYDYQDQLISAGNGTFSSYYNYDAEGNRTRKVVVKGNIREERYYIGGYEVFRKYINDTLDYERKTINISDDEKVFLRIEQKTGENEVIRYQYDNHLGSACLELDDIGQIISYEEYHPFGTTSYRSRRTETEVSLKRYKYCGKERDEETGLYYYGMRYYADWICRFVSVDPLQFKYPYYTPYQYAGNKPVSYIDLDGGEEKEQVKAYVNPDKKIFQQQRDNAKKKYEEVRTTYINYYKKIGKLTSTSTEEEINNAFSDANRQELSRLENIIEKNQQLLDDAIAKENQWNKLDKDIENIVYNFNVQKKLTGKNRLDPNLLKALMFSESEMGAGTDYLKLLKSVPINYPKAVYQLNLGRVTDANIYNSVVKEFNIGINWKTNYLANGNKYDVMLAAGALIQKMEYALTIKSSYFNTDRWFNAVVAYKGVSAEGARKARLVWRLYKEGIHPYSSQKKIVK